MDWLAPPLSETEVCGFRLEKLLGEGAYGRVYQVDGGYALKQQLFADGYPSPFALREAAILASARHANVLRSHGTFMGCDGFHTDRLSIVMELGDTTLSKQMTSLSMEEKEDVVMDLLAGLAFLTYQGIYHRDLKPDNILMGDGVAAIGDFGLSARIAHEREVQTLWYRAPEVVMGEVYDERADIWSLGCIIYELLHPNTPLFRRAGTPAQLLELQRTLIAPLRSDTLLARVMKDCLEFERDERSGALELLRRYFPDHEHDQGTWLRAPIVSGWRLPTVRNFLVQTKVPSYMWSQVTSLLLLVAKDRLIAEPRLLNALLYLASCLVEPLPVDFIRQLWRSSRTAFTPELNTLCNELKYRVFFAVPPWDLMVTYLEGNLDAEQASAFEQSDYSFYLDINPDNEMDLVDVSE